MENVKDAAKKDLERLNELEYSAVLEKKDGAFSLFIPELSCLARDVSLEKAYEKLESAKKEYFQKMVECGFQRCIPDPSRKRVLNEVRSPSFFSQWLLFGAKFLTVLLVVGILSGLVLDKTKSSLESALGSALDVAKDQVQQKLQDVRWGEIKHKLNIAFERLRDMPADVKEKRVSAIREFVTNIKPFSDEFLRLTVSEPSKQTREKV